MVNFDVNISSIQTQGLTAQKVLEWMDRVSGGRILTDCDKKAFLKHIRDTRFGEDSSQFRITTGANNEENYNALFLNRLNNSQISVDDIAKFICEKENLKLKHVRVFESKMPSNRPRILKDSLSPAEIADVGNEILQLKAPSRPKLTSIIYNQDILRFKFVTSVEENHLQRAQIETFDGVDYSPWEKIRVRKVVNIDVLPGKNRILVRSEAMTDKEYETRVRPLLIDVSQKLNLGNFSEVNFLGSIDRLIGEPQIKSSQISTTRFNLEGEPVRVTMKNENNGNVFEDEAFMNIDAASANLQHLPMEYAKIEWEAFGVTTYIDSKNGFIKIVSMRDETNGVLNGILQRLDAAFQ